MQSRIKEADILARLRYQAFCLFVLAVMLPLALTVGQAKTETHPFSVNANYGDSKVFSFEVKAAGTIRVQANWTGSAPRLALILNGPGQVGYYQRADGPSPLTVTQEVTPAILAKGTAWSVSIVNFGRSGQAAGTIQLEYPEATTGTAPGKTIPPGTHATLAASDQRQSRRLAHAPFGGSAGHRLGGPRHALGLPLVAGRQENGPRVRLQRHNPPQAVRAH